jgi:ribosomal protein L31
VGAVFSLGFVYDDLQIVSTLWNSFKMLMSALIKVLLKPLAVLFLIGLACHFFYTLGKKRALENKGRTGRARRRPRKVVQCKVVEDEEPCENNDGQSD